MERQVYYVVLAENDCKISYNGKHYGPFRTQAITIRPAVDAAHESGKKGYPAQVLIQDKNNQIRTERTYGNDPYPPPG